MTYQALYTDFYDNVLRLKEIHKKDLHEIPDTALSRLAEYYLNKRLFILNKKPVKLDPRQGRPLLRILLSGFLQLLDYTIHKN